MEDSWDDDGGGNDLGGSDVGGNGGGNGGWDLQGPPPRDDPGWRQSLDAAFEYAWHERHKPGDGECIYEAAIYVMGNNPISGYRVVLKTTP